MSFGIIYIMPDFTISINLIIKIMKMIHTMKIHTHIWHMYSVKCMGMMNKYRMKILSGSRMGQHRGTQDLQHDLFCSLKST